MKRAFVDLTREEFANNPSSNLFLGDIGAGGFVDANEQLVDRVHNVGIAEQSMIGFAAGLSLVTPTGNTIVHTIAPFLVERAFEQIKLCCGYNGAKLILVSANGPYDYGKLGPTHHCAADVNVLSTIPNLEIRLPSTKQDFEEIYREALASDKSTYIRVTSRGAKLDVEPTPIGEYKKVRLPSSAVTTTTAIVCTGESLAYVLKNLKTSATVYWSSNPRAPLPEEVERHSRIVVIEPYMLPLIKAPDRAERRHFKVEHKKIIQTDMGWEDFEDPS